MPIPDFQSIMLPALELTANRESIRLKDADAALADVFNLSEEEREENLPRSNQKRFYNRVSWAMGHLYYAGLLARPKTGLYQITDEGIKVLRDEPKYIDINSLKKHPAYQEFQSKKKAPKSESGVSAQDADESKEERLPPTERIDIAHNDLSAELEHELLQRISAASPEFFEKLVLDLLVAMGYGGASEDSGEHQGRSGDGGIDGIIKEDKLGLDVIYVQAKRYTSASVGIADVRDFVGSLAGESADKGVFFTTSSFPKNALEYVKTVPQRVILIDGSELTRLMIENNLGVRLHRVVEFKRIDEDFFQES